MYLIFARLICSVEVQGNKKVFALLQISLVFSFILNLSDHKIHFNVLDE